MKLKKLSTPTSPISIKDAKNFFRIIGDEHNADIQRAIDASVERAEQITNLQLAKVTYEGYLDSFQRTIKLPKPPFISLSGFEYINADGERVVFEDYYIDDIAIPSVIYCKTIPSDVSDDKNSVIITFETGYEVLPKAIESWILINALTMFENRENAVIGTIVDTKFKTYHDHLLDSFRIRP